MKYRQKSTLEAITFDELVEYGRRNGANIVNGMPWAFTYMGMPVSHENDKCYIIGTQHCTDADLIVTFTDGHVSPENARIFLLDYEPVETLRAIPAVGDVAMPVMAGIVCSKSDDVTPVDMAPTEKDVNAWASHGFNVVALVRQSDAQAALAAKNAEIAPILAASRYTCDLCTQAMDSVRELTTERDALLVAAKYAAHIDATPENQLQTMLYDTLTERDALRKDAERYRWLVHSNWFDDAIMDAVGITDGMSDTVNAAIDAAMTKGAK